MPWPLETSACTAHLSDLSQIDNGPLELLEFDPTESAGFLVGRVAHALKLRVQEFLDDAGIDLFAEEISILTVLAHLDGPERMKSLAAKTRS